MTTLNTEQFTSYWINKIKNEAEEKGYKNDWKFNFKFTEQDLPFDWEQSLFHNIMKSNFNLSYFEITKRGSYYEVIGMILAENPELLK